MCGRFSQRYTWSEIYDYLQLLGPPRNIQPRYNIAPTQDAWTVTAADDGLEARQMRWTLIPSHFKGSEPKDWKYSTINARAEAVDKSPSFRAAFRSRRCVVPVSGFYEWQLQPDGSKRPFYIHDSGSPVLALAGLWERWEDIEGFTIIVCPANELFGDIHNTKKRMPVILRADQVTHWLDEDTPVEALKTLLAPYEGELDAYEVSKAVNSPKNDRSDLIDQVAG